MACHPSSQRSQKKARDELTAQECLPHAGLAIRARVGHKHAAWTLQLLGCDVDSARQVELRGKSMLTFAQEASKAKCCCDVFWICFSFLCPAVVIWENCTRTLFVAMWFLIVVLSCSLARQHSPKSISSLGPPRAFRIPLDFVALRDPTWGIS